MSAQLANDILRRVAKTFSVNAILILGKGQQPHIVRARHVWWYLCVQFLPAPTRHAARNGGTRAVRDSDGNIKPTARVLGIKSSALRYGLRRVEDERETSAELDDQVTALEAALAAPAHA